MRKIKNAQKRARNRIAFFAVIFLTFSSWNSTYSQELNTAKLNELFDAVERRNEAMGSIAILKNGEILYQRAIGYRFVSDNKKILADIETKYRIWSVTKIYTATMILQLVEEEKLSLNTTLDHFYQEIPNAERITIEQMLRHRSGIHDFTQNQPGAPPAINENSQNDVVQNIVRFKSDFMPDERLAYSNSNYVLLGYIIEKLDGVSYSNALSNRISLQIGLSDTYFESLDDVENKSYTYRFDQHWINVDEGDFGGLIPVGAGGIVSTPTDMAIFINALFTGKLISTRSLDMMTKNKDYGLGIYRMPFFSTMGFGHTGGYIASESSLTYYPQDSLVIAYCTNGIVYKKERILNNVLNICYDKPVSIVTSELVALSREELNKYLGLYSNEQINMKVNMQREGNVLVAEVEGRGKYRLNYKGQHVFFDEEVIVEFNLGGDFFIFKQGEREMKFIKNK